MGHVGNVSKQTQELAAAPKGATQSSQGCQAQPWGCPHPSPREVCPLSWPLMQYTATARNSVATTSAMTMPEMVGASTSMQFWHTGNPKGHKH